MRSLAVTVIAMVGLLVLTPGAFATDVKIAVAANFTPPMEKIAALFFKETGHKLVISYGATGKFYAQIKNGAPFEIFLAADQKHPQRLIAEKLAVAGTQFTYAIGKIVLWSPKLNVVDPDGAILGSGDFKHLAIANPKIAPYGAAAEEVLKKKDLWQKLQPRLVVGENIAQAYQFVATGNAELGFVALSQLKKENEPSAGSAWAVPQELYSPLKQDAVLLAKGKASAAAKQFLAFLKSKKATALTRVFGYE